MNLDELPTEVLFALVLIGWAGYFALIVWERRRNSVEQARLTSTSLELRPTGRRLGDPLSLSESRAIGTQSREDRRSDHHVQQSEADAEPDQPAEHDEEDHRIESHARTLHRGRDR